MSMRIGGGRQRQAMHLQTTEGFERAAKELLEWCSDQRAFQKAFETSLMQCLTVISEVAAKPGFNLSLGYRLLAICSANHDKFSTKSSGMLRYWCEDLGKALLLQHQKNNRSNDGMKPPLSTNPSPGPHGGHMGMSYPPGPMGPRMGYNDPTVWNPNNPGPNHGPIPPRPQQPSLSVITTVWGVTNTTQTPPIRGQSMAPLNQYSQHMGPGSVPHPRPHSQGPGYVNNYMSKANSYSAPGHYARQDSYGAPMGGTHRGMHGSGYSPNAGGHQGHHDGSDYPPAAAAAAAAVAAAAATATATATATLIATDQQQQQQNDMYDQHAGNSMHPIDGNSMHAHGGNMAQRGMMRPEHGGHSDMMVPGNREPPRPNMPPQYTQINRGMGPGGPHSMGVPHHPNNSPMGSHNSAAFNHMSYRSQYRPSQNSYGHAAFHTNPMPPNQFKSPPLGGHPHTGQGGYNPSLPTPSSQGPPTPLLTATPDLYPSVSSAGAGIGSGFYPNPHHQTPNPSHPLPGPGHGYPQQRMGYNNQYNSMGYRSHPQHGQPQNPMPGNPTPPLTPGSVHNVPPYPGSDVKPPPSHLDVKPIIPNQDNEEMRMTFPVRDGIVLEPFRLEHNRSVSTHAFHLRPQAYQTLMWRSDLELQFKCYHHDDKMRCTNWPLSVQVKVNNRNMIIPRNPVSKPLYLREVCQSGRNAIEISVSTCCCSHLFVLQLVHRPSVRSVLMGLLQKRMLPAAHCVTKIKRYFSSGVISGNKSMLGSPIGPNDLDSNCVIVPLRCPITFKRINLPARGSECKHIQCFDLEAYLQLNSDKRTWKCPICKKSALLEGLEVDQYIWSILNQSHAEDMEVTIDQQCNWKSITVKQEHPYGDEQDGPPLKRIRTGMSPATMLNHLPSPGSYVPQMTPLPPARLTMTPDMNPGGPPGFPQSSGGCGFNGSNGNGMSNADGGMENYGITGVLSPNNPMPIPPMNVPDILGGPLHRANAMPMSQNDNIAANDMVTIKRRLNHAVANNNNNTNPNISSPRAMGHSNALQSSNAPPMPMSKCQTPQNSGLQSAMDPRVRTPISCTMSNLTPNTPGNPSTPGLGLSPSIISPPTTNINNMNNSASNLGPVAPGNGLPPGINIKTEALNFDPTAIINDGVMGDNAENIPTLDILPENTDTLDLTDILGVDNSSSNDDILSLFDIQS